MSQVPGASGRPHGGLWGASWGPPSPPGPYFLQGLIERPRLCNSTYLTYLYLLVGGRCLRMSIGRPEGAFSAVYGCGYNLYGFNLRLSQVRSGSIGVDLGPVWGPKGAKPAANRPQATSTGPRTTSICSHMSCIHTLRSPTFVVASWGMEPKIELEELGAAGAAHQRILG